MKKIVLSGGAALVALGLIFYGPEVLDIYHLQNYISTSAEADEAEGGPWPRLTDACVMCHGVRGNSLHQAYPSLAAQPAAYLTAQLRNFASGERSNPNMGPLAMTLSDKDINSLADYFAGQPAEENLYFEPEAGVREQGKQLVESSGCAGCHGSRQMGQAQFPRLAGQGYDYLLRQLDAFASGERTDPTGMMNNLSAAASPGERQAMASYLAGLLPNTQ